MTPAIESTRPPLASFFCPRTVAVIGATENPSSVGRTISLNLCQTSFGGRVFPVNPGRQQVFGSKCHGSIREIDEHVDLAVIATPAHTVQPIIGECVAAGVDAAIIISAGFREIGERG